MHGRDSLRRLCQIQEAGIRKIVVVDLPVSNQSLHSLFLHFAQQTALRLFISSVCGKLLQQSVVIMRQIRERLVNHLDQSQVAETVKRLKSRSASLKLFTGRPRHEKAPIWVTTGIEEVCDMLLPVHRSTSKICTIA